MNTQTGSNKFLRSRSRAYFWGFPAFAVERLYETVLSRPRRAGLSYKEDIRTTQPWRKGNTLPTGNSNQWQDLKATSASYREYLGCDSQEDLWTAWYGRDSESWRYLQSDDDHSHHQSIAAILKKRGMYFVEMIGQDRQHGWFIDVTMQVDSPDGITNTKIKIVIGSENVWYTNESANPRISVLGPRRGWYL